MFLEPIRKPHLHWQFLGIRQSLWRSFLESLYVDTTQIGNKWDCWKSGTQNKRRDVCRAVTIWHGWKGWFRGMLLLSAKSPKSSGRWETHLMNGSGGRKCRDRRDVSRRSNEVLRPRRHVHPEKGSLSGPSTSAGDRQHIINSGASLHIVGRSSLTSTETTVFKSDTLCLMMMAKQNGRDERGATVHTTDLDIFLCVKLADDSPTALSFWMLCETMD